MPPFRNVKLIFKGASMQEKAKDYFLGKNGPRLNCARAVAETFKDKYPVEEKTGVPLSACGGGMAPGGLCGAFYAAKCIFEHYLPERTEKGMEQLRAAAGSLKCREIKALRKLPCHECVAKAAEVIDR